METTWNNMLIVKNHEVTLFVGWNPACFDQKQPKSIGFQRTVLSFCFHMFGCEKPCFFWSQNRWVFKAIQMPWAHRAASPMGRAPCDTRSHYLWPQVGWVCWMLKHVETTQKRMKPKLKQLNTPGCFSEKMIQNHQKNENNTFFLPGAEAGPKVRLDTSGLFGIPPRSF